MRRNRSAFVLALCLALLQACAPTVLKPEIPILGSDLEAPASVAEHTKVLFFNNSNKLMFGPDNTGKVGVTIDGKGLAVLQIGEYVQVSLPRGRCLIELVHVDMFAFRSKHDLLVETNTTYVEVYATAVSNGMNVFPSLPTGNYLPKPFTPYQRQ